MPPFLVRDSQNHEQKVSCNKDNLFSIYMTDEIQDSVNFTLLKLFYYVCYK